uniref:DUF2946 domain-containing protein n=1 Tax=uncultured bacterium 50 TaxID=1748278 RepID=A0A0U3BC62_9BACT|nr:hypothetical protein [uncultured bacterium 50]
MQPVFPVSRSRPLIWIALFAWLAQLCLPGAHAAVMARHDGGLSGWCGNFSPAMAAKVAALPDEIRNIIAPGADQHAAAEAGCQLLCAGSAGTAMPADGNPASSMPAFAIEIPIARADSNPQPLPTLRPPPRGPPLTR